VISGSTRVGSTNSAFAASAVAWPPAGVDVVAYDGLTQLPHFEPDADGDTVPGDYTIVEKKRERRTKEGSVTKRNKVKKTKKKGLRVLLGK